MAILQNLADLIRNVPARAVYIFGATGDTPARVDDTADCDGVVVIDTIHDRMHRGQFFTAGLVNLALANNGTLELLLRVSTGAHVRFAANNGGDARVQLFENATFSDPGSAVTRVNRNRFSSKTAKTLISSAPTISDDGDSIFDKVLAGGSGFFFTSGGELGSFEEYILSPGDYLFRLTNLSGSTQPADLQLDFYENV